VEVSVAGLTGFLSGWLDASPLCAREGAYLSGRLRAIDP
jgi:hypothetical protein